MSIFKKKKPTESCKVLTDNYVPFRLPSPGYGLDNVIPSEYPANMPDVIKDAYTDVEEHLKGVIDSCDHHSSGTECDIYIDSQINHAYAYHEASIASHEHQLTRILSAQKMRIDDLNRQIIPLDEKIDKLKSEIAPLEGLELQFPRIRLGNKKISVGLLITIAACILDALVNYSFLSGILLSNATLLAFTVICMSVCSDCSMWGLATYLNHKEETFTNKYVYWSVCFVLLGAFLLSVVASFMIRYGSMDTTYGTINAAGEFVGKETYSMAEYGVTLITAFVTTVTGILSFSFSLDKNAFRISIRERKEKELTKCLAERTLLQNERSLLEHAPDIRKLDEHKRIAAEHQLEAMAKGLKLDCHKLMVERINDADFTEHMAVSGEALLAESSSTNTTLDTTVTCAAGHLEKVS